MPAQLHFTEDAVCTPGKQKDVVCNCCADGQGHEPQGLTTVTSCQCRTVTLVLPLRVE